MRDDDTHNDDCILHNKKKILVVSPPKDVFLYTHKPRERFQTVFENFPPYRYDVYI